MKLIKVLEIINQIEKSSFLKLLDGYCVESRKTTPKINKILSEYSGQIKNIDDENIVKIFNLLKDCYRTHLTDKVKYSNYNLDILVDIIIRDGNSIMSKEWFSNLYSKEIKKLKKNVRNFSSMLKEEANTLDVHRIKDYNIYQKCVRTAYENDRLENREPRLSKDEKSILFTLSKSLGLSNEEIRWITYTVVPIQIFEVDDLIAELKDIGILFYNRKTNTAFIPDEIIWLLREIEGIELPDKFLRRILRNLTNTEISLIAKRYNIEYKLSRNKKINGIISQGVSATNVLTNDMFRDNVTKPQRANRIYALMSKDLEMGVTKWGRSLEERIHIIVDYFNSIEKDDSTVLSKDGYNSLLRDLKKVYPLINKSIKSTFQLQDENVLLPDYLDNYNIKPRDVIYLLKKDEIKQFCNRISIKTSGNVVKNIIDNYKNIDDMLIENFNLVGNRDFNGLSEKGLTVKESELGIIYEKLTKKLLSNLGFNVDEKLRKKLNTKRAKIDVLLNLGSDEVVVVECKTKKDIDYNKYTAVSRQLNSYVKICESQGLRVTKAIVVSSGFSEEFISECEYDYELNLSLITSNALVQVFERFKESKLKEFPVRLFFKGGLLDANRILKMLNR